MEWIKNDLSPQDSFNELSFVTNKNIILTSMIKARTINEIWEVISLPFCNNPKLSFSVFNKWESDYTDNHWQSHKQQKFEISIQDHNTKTSVWSFEFIKRWTNLEMVHRYMNPERNSLWISGTEFYKKTEDFLQLIRDEGDFDFKNIDFETSQSDVIGWWLHKIWFDIENSNVPESDKEMWLSWSKNTRDSLPKWWKLTHLQILDNEWNIIRDLQNTIVSSDIWWEWIVQMNENRVFELIKTWKILRVKMSKDLLSESQRNKDYENLINNTHDQLINEKKQEIKKFTKDSIQAALEVQTKHQKKIEQLMFQLND